MNWLVILILVVIFIKCSVIILNLGFSVNKFCFLMRFVLDIYIIVIMFKRYGIEWWDWDFFIVLYIIDR